MLVGHGGEAIVDHVGDGSRFGLDVEFVHDPPELLGTGGALRHALPALGPAFFVTYGDTLLEVPMDRLERRLLSSRAAGRDDRAGESGPMGDQQRRRGGWSGDGVREGRRRRARHRFLDYGMLAMRATAFEAMTTPDRSTWRR